MNKVYFLILPLLLGNLLSATENNTETNSSSARQVEITDSATNQLETIIDENKLNRFFYFWSQKQPLKQATVYQWRYQIVIHDHNGISRWVYDPKGFIGEVSINKLPMVYQLATTRSFNRFLVKE